MAKQLDAKIVEVLKDYGFDKSAAWDCHGTWVVYHRVLEQIAAQAGISFDPPLPLETNGAGKSVAICVTGRKGVTAEWSIGEASPGNNKNSYPYAMAEKRAKDRVILKLIGLHGLAYSEDEADDFKASAPVSEAPKAEGRSSNTVQTALPIGMEPDDRTAARAAYLSIAQTALENADTNEEIDDWLRTETAARKKIGLIEGSPHWPEFKTMVTKRRAALSQPEGAAA